MGFMGNPHFNNGVQVAPLPRQTIQPAGMHEMQAAINGVFARLAAQSLIPRHFIDASPKPKRGDKVKLAVTAYVSKVNADGTFAVASEREAFADPIVLDRVHGSRVKVVEAGPVEPRVGDIISGDIVRATPWKRGTIVRWVNVDGSDGSAYVLMHHGKWTDLDSGVSNIEFRHFTGPKFRVEHAPGKAA